MAKETKSRAQQLAERLEAERKAAELRRAILGAAPKKFYGGGPLPEHFRPKDSSRVQLSFDTVYVTKEELEDAHNPTGAEDFANETIRALSSKSHELMHYYMTYPLDDEEPPKPAEFLAYLFLSRTDREVLLGDLTEEYPSVVEKFGQRAAQVYFYKQVLCSVWPLVRKVVIKWGAFGWVAEVIRRISS